MSDDPAKLRALGRKYGVEQLYSYDEYELAEADIDVQEPSS